MMIMMRKSGDPRKSLFKKEKEAKLLHSCKMWRNLNHYYSLVDMTSQGRQEMMMQAKARQEKRTSSRDDDHQRRPEI
jgi:hypothetical protein